MNSESKPDSQSEESNEASESNVDDKKAHIQQRLKELGVSDDSERPNKSWVSRYGNYLLVSAILTLAIIYWLEYRTIDKTEQQVAVTSTTSHDQVIGSNGVPYTSSQVYQQPQSREQWMQQQAIRQEAMRKQWQQQQQRRLEWEKKQYEQQVKAWQQWQEYIKQQQEAYQANQRATQNPHQPNATQQNNMPNYTNGYYGSRYTPPQGPYYPNANR